MIQDWSNLIFSNDIFFDEKARQIFDYQFENNPVYQRYCRALGVHEAKNIEEIPLLPVKAFKDTEILTDENNSRLKTQDSKLFQSSGTSSMRRSSHKVLDISIYEQSLLRGFRRFYDLNNAVVLGYTPGYNENPRSSLIYMIKTLIEQDESGSSCFLPLDEPLKTAAVDVVKKEGKQLIIFGAAFGLLDLAEVSALQLPSNSVIIETGGMKTHRRAISRNELHQKLADGFRLDISRIHSEYGMCELLSQAYSTGGKWFHTLPWMNVSIRDPENPFKELTPFSEGLIGIIDLANVYSCSFLLTGDRGMRDNKGRFQVLGRWNPKNLRGCNFLIEED